MQKVYEIPAEKQAAYRERQRTERILHAARLSTLALVARDRPLNPEECADLENAANFLSNLR